MHVPEPATHHDLGDRKQWGNGDILKTLAKIIYSYNSDPEH